ncbi:MAG: helix-turn-helix transcriptional regulator [Candidatus Hydrogenedentes bacterium]|nr:helix-turn-helix transcriptional regulator [Candidatus Hydrogenedentota bacterium]
MIHQPEDDGRVFNERLLYFQQSLIGEIGVCLTDSQSDFGILCWRRLHTSIMQKMGVVREVVTHAGQGNSKRIVSRPALVNTDLPPPATLYAFCGDWLHRKIEAVTIKRVRLVIPDRLPNYLRGARKALGLSQKELAFLLGAETASNVTRYEHFRRTPTLPTALALEAILDMPVRELFAGLFAEAEGASAAQAKKLLIFMEGLQSNRHSPVKRAFLDSLAGKAPMNSNSIYDPHR